MLDVHQIKKEYHFESFYQICQREKIDFFLLIELIKLLQLSMDKGEDVFDKRIEFSRVKDRKLLNTVLKNKKMLLLDVGENAFVVKEEMVLLLEEILNLQKQQGCKQKKFQEHYGGIYLHS